MLGTKNAIVKTDFVDKVDAFVDEVDAFVDEVGIESIGSIRSWYQPPPLALLESRKTIGVAESFCLFLFFTGFLLSFFGFFYDFTGSFNVLF